MQPKPEETPSVIGKIELDCVGVSALVLREEARFFQSL